MKKKFITTNNTYFLRQPINVKYTIVERISHVTEVITEAIIDKNVEDVTREDVLNLDFCYQY
jgi:hypothetical protein